MTVEDISKYISDEVNATVLKCECISNESANVKSFKITVPIDDITKMFIATAWPENIHVRQILL